MIYFRSLLFAWLGAAGCCFAQQPYDYQNPSTAPAGEMPAWMLRQDPKPQWRPETKETGGSQKPSARARNRSPAGYRPEVDYVEEPLGLPPGTYRQIEERLTITPYQDGFHFRPIEPGEQLEIQGRYRDSSRQAENSQSPVPGVQGWNGRGYIIERQSPAPLFRPDVRLDKGSRKSPRRYSYPQHPVSPMFRPE